MNPVEAQPVAVALVEAVAVSERVQRRDVTRADILPQQPQSDQGARPPQHLQGALLAAALQTRPVHLRGGGDETTYQ